MTTMSDDDLAERQIERARPTNVIEALARVMEDLPAIAKKRHPSADGDRGVTYPYRGIEEITAEAQGLFAKYGVVPIPWKTVPLDSREFQVKSGATWTDEKIEIHWRIYGPGGVDDMIEAQTLGIGRDNSDKAFNKGATQCQPAGTLVRVPTRAPGGHAGFREVPIESITWGTKVVTWDRCRSVMAPRGRKVTGVASRPYDGSLVVAKAGTRYSRYTPDHHCLVRLPDSLGGGDQVVYLMRRAGQYRIGRCCWRGTTSDGTRGRVGLAWRLWSEKADAGWILSVHDTVENAAMEETLASVRFGIPQTSFTGRSDSYRKHRSTAFSLDQFWGKVGDNRAQAMSCLTSFGRLIDRPLVERLHPHSQVGQLPTIETAAANLLAGMLVAVPKAPETDERGWQKWPLEWLPIETWREYYSGTVHSLAVDVDHNYVADGIITHNCLKYLLLPMLLIADPKDDADGKTQENDGGSSQRRETTRRAAPRRSAVPDGQATVPAPNPASRVSADDDIATMPAREVAEALRGLGLEDSGSLPALRLRLQEARLGMTGAAPEVPADDAPKLASEKQVGFVNSFWRDVSREDRLDAITDLIGRPIESSHELTAKEAHDIIEAMKDPS